jgi:LacI family transcriptional regulator
MGYQPNILARSLVHRRSHTLGIVATGLEYYGPSTTLVGIEERATELGYSIVLSLVHRPHVHDVAQVLNSLLSRQVDGVIWAVPEIGANRTWLQQRTPSLPVPVVFLSMHRADELPVVSVDNYAGARMAANHLLEQGYREIGLITGPLDWWEARERKRGWEDRLREAGLKVEARQVFEGDWSASSGERGFEELADRYPEMDSLFACNDQMALGVLQACYRKGRRVPSELGLVGFDDIPESAYFWPPLTTVRQELRELGGRGVEQVSRMIAAMRGEAPAAPQDAAWLTPRLVVRGSSVAR